MLYLCLSLVALLCVFPLALKAHHIHSLCVLYRVCYAGQNHPFLLMNVCQWEDSFVVRLPDPSRNRDDFLPTLWRSKWSCCCSAFGSGLSHFPSASLVPAIGLEVLWHSFPPARAHKSPTSTRCRANTGQKSAHGPLLWHALILGPVCPEVWLKVFYKLLLLLLG